MVSRDDLATKRQNLLCGRWLLWALSYRGPEISKNENCMCCLLFVKIIHWIFLHCKRGGEILRCVINMSPEWTFYDVLYAGECIEVYIGDRK